MKNFIILSIILLTSSLVMAQAPQSFNYQALAADNSGQIYSETDIDIRFSILENSANGTAVYSEEHQVRTSKNGIFSLHIGDGTILSGQFNSISWDQNKYWLKVEMDVDGSGYNFMGTSAFQSVPYALHAETVTDKNDADADPNNELQLLSINGNQLTISGGNTVNIPTGGGGSGDDDPNNEIQNLSHTKNGNDVTVDISLGQGTTFSVEDGDSDAQNEIQNLSLNGNQLTISGGNNIDLSPLKSRWKDIPAGIQFDEGLVRILDQNTQKEIAMDGSFIVGSDGSESYEITPNEMSWNRSDKRWSSSLDAVGLDVYDQTTPERTYITKDSTVITDTLCTTVMKPGLIYLDDEQNLSYSSYSKDSLYYFQTIGLLYPDVAVLKPTHIEFKTWGTDLRSTMGPGAQRNFDSQFTSEVTPNQFRIWEKSQPTSFDRVILSGDSLSIWNSAKWKTIDAKSDTDLGGTLNLNNPSGINLVHIGARPDDLFNSSPTGNVILNDEYGLARNVSSVFDGSGSNMVTNDSAYAYSGDGQMIVGRLSGNPNDFQILTEMAVMGYDTLREAGFTRIYGGHGTPEEVAFLGSTDIDSKSGRMCLYNENDHLEKVCAIADKFNGGMMYLFGEQGANFFAGGENELGQAYVADSFGFRRAGMGVEEWNGGIMYVRNDGRFAVQDEDGQAELATLDGHGILFNDTTQGGAAFLGRDFEFSNSGVQWLWGANGIANAYIGVDREEGELGPSGNFGVFRAFDEDGNYRSWMSGTGDFGGLTLRVRDFNDNNKIVGGTIPFDNSSYLNLYGSNGNLNISMHGSTPGNNGTITVHDEDGNIKAGAYVNDFTGQGHIFGDIKNFRMDHPTQPDKEIWYASLEGPEAGAYVRGTASLINGEAFVPFPDHFTEVCGQEKITIQLTPRHWDTYGLAVVEIKSNGFVVKELKGETGSFEFDWEAKGIRKGFENYKAVISKSDLPESLQTTHSIQ